jgi:type IV secretion system protein TrbJ
MNACFWDAAIAVSNYLYWLKADMLSQTCRARIERPRTGALRHQTGSPAEHRIRRSSIVRNEELYMRKHFLLGARHYIIASALRASVGFSLVAVLGVASMPAHAQITVFDPSNYSQNLLTAARSLSQINNQIKMLQNQAQSLINQGKNLSTISFPELQALQKTLQQIDQLMGQAQGIQFKVSGLDQQFKSMFPTSFNALLTSNQQVTAARTRLDTSMAAYKQTMSVQAQVVENIAADEANLAGIVSRSQSAEGALQAAQATNQLLTLVAKQQFQIQTLMAAQYRADALERANRTQAQRDAQGATAKFLGSGNADTPR